MNIVYSANDAFAWLGGISLLSVLENNKDTDQINVYFIDNEISDENKNRIQKICDDYSRNLKFVSFPEQLLNVDINTYRWSMSTFARLFEAEVLPDVDKVIHIDCDTIITGSLKEVWDIDMSNAIVAGALDCVGDRYKPNLGLKVEETYFNAGFLLFNLARIREKNYVEKFYEYIKEHSDFIRYMDQGVLNSCVPENEKVKFSLKYNSYSMIHFFKYKQIRRIRRISASGFPEDEYNEAKSNPVVVHYTGCFMDGVRPWIEGDIHPLRHLFLEYKAISPWKDESLLPDNRSGLKKAITKLVNIMPKLIVVEGVGLIHGVLIPLNDKRKRSRA